MIDANQITQQQPGAFSSPGGERTPEKKTADLFAIKDNVEKWTHDNLGSKFAFRKGQLEAIVYIIDNILNRELETSVLQMPTGSGKSLTCIIAAGTLAVYYKIRSYILASDLYLWQQYADAIDKYHLKQFGYLKGSIGNYWCDMWHTDYNVGKCRVEKVGIAQMRNRDWRVSNGWTCADSCLYMRQRFRAERAQVTLLTYQLWLYQMNLVDHGQDAAGFVPRQVVFCDECHNIPDIVGKYAQPVIDVVNDRQRLTHIVEYLLDHNIKPSWEPQCMRPDILNKTDVSTERMRASDCFSVETVMDNYEYFIDCLHIISEIDHRTDVKYGLLIDFTRVLAFLESMVQDALDEMSGSSAEAKGISKKELKQQQTDYKILSWLHNYASMISEFCRSITSAGDRFAVIEENKDRITGNISYTLSCVKEDYLCYNYLLKHAKNRVMLSATVGSKQAFIESIGMKYSQRPSSYEFTDMPSTFDFEKSPIYFMPKYKMSWQNKDHDFPIIRQIVYRILNSPKFADKHGMINTGSYENAKKIYDNAPENIKRRLCMYISSKDKNDTIEAYKRRKDRVLIGPTLVEGVDLPDDLCRFIIIVKIPYPNISSKTVKAKMNIFPLWYESTTSNTVIQNIGRGVRNENDYCETFILDGCFQRLYESTYEQYPEEIRNRIKLI